MEKRYYSSSYCGLLSIDQYVAHLVAEKAVDAHQLVKHHPPYNVVAYTGAHNSVKRRVAIHPSSPSWFSEFLYNVRSAHMIDNEIENHTEALKYASVSLNGVPITEDSGSELRANGEVVPLRVEFSNRMRRGTWHAIPATDPAEQSRKQHEEKMLSAERELNAQRDSDNTPGKMHYFDATQGLKYYPGTEKSSPLMQVADTITTDFVSKLLDTTGSSADATEFSIKPTEKVAVFKQALAAVNNKENYANCSNLSPNEFWTRCGITNTHQCMADIANSITASAVATPLHGLSSRSDAESLLKTQIVGDGIFQRWYQDIKSMAQNVLHCSTARYELRGDYGLQWVDSDSKKLVYPTAVGRGERLYTVRHHQGGPLVGYTAGDSDRIYRLYSEMTAAPVDGVAPSVSKELRMDLLRDKMRLSDIEKRFRGYQSTAAPKELKTADTAPVSANVSDSSSGVTVIEMQLSDVFNKDSKAKEFALETVTNASAAFPTMSNIESPVDMDVSDALDAPPRTERRGEQPGASAARTTKARARVTQTTTTLSTAAAGAPITETAAKKTAKPTPPSSKSVELPDLFTLVAASPQSVVTATRQSSASTKPAVESVFISMHGNEFEKKQVTHVPDDSAVVVYLSKPGALRSGDTNTLNHYAFSGESNHELVKSLLQSEVNECQLKSDAGSQWTFKQRDGALQAKFGNSSAWHPLQQIGVFENPGHLSFRIATPHTEM